MKVDKMYSSFRDEDYRKNYDDNYELMLEDIKNGKLNLTIEDYVQVYDDILDADKCEEIIKNIENNNTQLLRFGGELTDLVRKGEFVNTFVGNRSFINYIEKIIEEINEKVKTKYLNDVRPLYYSYGNKFNHYQYHVLKYTPDDYFKIHHDHYAETLNYSRLISICVYLNDDYEGGELDFPSINKKFKFKSGQAIVFPSNWMFQHGVTPITSGNRYTFVIWLGLDLTDTEFSVINPK